MRLAREPALPPHILKSKTNPVGRRALKVRTAAPWAVFEETWYSVCGQRLVAKAPVLTRSTCRKGDREKERERGRVIWIRLFELWGSRPFLPKQVSPVEHWLGKFCWIWLCGLRAHSPCSHFGLGQGLAGRLGQVGPA